MELLIFGDLQLASGDHRITEAYLGRREPSSTLVNKGMLDQSWDPELAVSIA